MHRAQGKLTHTLFGPDAAGQIACPPGLIPAPGQYLLARAGSDLGAHLPVPVFMAASALGGFMAAPPLPESWLPGALIDLRGPLGKGFSLPRAARRVALVVLGWSAARLLPLVRMALAQDASVLMLSAYTPGSLPHAVEVLPLYGLAEAASWADFMALDLPREALAGLPSELKHVPAQALVDTPLPCGGMADCGACAVHLRHGYLLACKDGPVVDLKRLV